MRRDECAGNKGQSTHAQLSNQGTMALDTPKASVGGFILHCVMPNMMTEQHLEVQENSSDF